MEEAFLLKYYGQYSNFEMAFLTAEERKWLIERISKEKSKEADSAKASAPVLPHIPKVQPPHR